MERFGRVGFWSSMNYGETSTLSAARLFLFAAWLSFNPLWLKECSGQTNLVDAPRPAASLDLPKETTATNFRGAAVAGPRANCQSCHLLTDGLVPGEPSFLNGRTALSRDEWARELVLPARCGVCHVLPDPSYLAGPGWFEAVNYMIQVMQRRGFPVPPRETLMDILHYYLTF